MKTLTANAPFFFTITAGRKEGFRVGGTVKAIKPALGGGFYGMKEQAVLKAVYSAADAKEDADRASAVELFDGETVQVDGEAYRVDLLGDYLDCVEFFKV